MVTEAGGPRANECRKRVNESRLLGVEMRQEEKSGGGNGVRQVGDYER